MIRFKLYYDKDKETVWLNQMASEGWALKSFFAGFYKFEPCRKGEYIYQIDLGDTLYSVSDEYRELMGELGVEIVVLWGYWIILRKRAADGPFELYTDVESKIEHYRKIRRMFKAVTILELIGLFMEIFAGMTGTDFAWAFALLLSVFVFVCVSAVFRTNKVIARLEEEKSGIEAEKKGGNTLALIITSIGLLTNSCMMFVEESVSPFISYPVHIFAVIMMAVGIVLTVKEGK